MSVGSIGHQVSGAMTNILQVAKNGGLKAVEIGKDEEGKRMIRVVPIKLSTQQIKQIESFIKGLREQEDKIRQQALSR